MVYVNTNVYTNPDGLSINFGTAQGVATNIGSPIASGSNKRIEVDISVGDLAAFGTTNYIFRGVPMFPIPKGSTIISATFITTVAFTGTGATLDIGLAKNDGTEIDYNGLFAALAQTAMTPAGTSATGAGSLIATVTGADAGYISTNVNTANFTAGSGRLIVEYFVGNP